MTLSILDFAKIINEFLVVKFNPHLGIWQASMENGEIKQGKFLLGEWGAGSSCDAAIDDYAKLIRGKVLVFHAMSSKLRREFTVPSDMTGLEKEKLQRMTKKLVVKGKL